ncbi:chromosome segregation protein SMC [Campylobacterota bacterium]|nr:chromosome segregation protein SMC [Campylobacterota bacterium]
MFIRSIKLNNFLSFGDKAEAIQLSSLNVVIGANGTGKSNLLEAIDLLRNAPNELTKPIREGGGVTDWLWKGGENIPAATIDAIIEKPERNLRYLLSFTAVGQRFEIVDERIENEQPDAHQSEPYFYYRFNRGRPYLNIKSDKRSLNNEDIDKERSILAQRRDPDQYPEITDIAKEFSRIKLYREWCFGRYTTPRMPQKADLPNEFLESDASNLGLVLNRIDNKYPSAKRRILEALNVLYDGIDGYSVSVEGGTVQVFFQERGYSIPATRLSDGTLRYLCLLAILCHPAPPPLICIEEPELGLHPDVLPTIAELLKEASTRCQLIVTTHSDVLVDAMTDQPESVFICEKDESGTTLRNLSSDELKPWLERYRLGELWTRGELGGTRW